MKNKKILIISLIIMILIVIIWMIAKPFHDSKVFDQIGQDELIEQLRKIEDVEQRQKEIENAIKKDG